MQGAVYEIKSGKHFAFRSAEQKKFIRLRSLGDGYFDDEIKAVIEGKTPQREVKKSVGKQPKRQEKSVNLLVDIQAKLQQGKGKGYEQWAKIFNLKQMAQTVSFLQEHNLLAYADLEEKAKKCTATFDELNTQIKTAEKRMTEIAVLKKHIISYAQTRDIYTDYRKAGYSKKFYEEHRAELTLHKAAKAAFDELGVKKLPTVKTLQAEYALLLSEKKKVYGQYHSAKKEMQDILTAKANIDRLLGLEQEERTKEKSQEQRKLSCGFISSQRERSTMIYQRFSGDWGYSPTSKSIRWSPLCPACHFCSQTIRRILYSVICFDYDGYTK